MKKINISSDATPSYCGVLIDNTYLIRAGKCEKADGYYLESYPRIRGGSREEIRDAMLQIAYKLMSAASQM